MSRRKGISPLSVALLVIPVVLGIGAYAFTASESLMTGVAPCPNCGDDMAGNWHGIEHHHGAYAHNCSMGECGTREHDMAYEDRETVSVDGIVADVSVDDRVISVEDVNGDVYDFMVGGRWASADGEWVPYYYLLGNITVGESIHIVGYVGCDGELRATSITADGVTYTWVTGGHGPHGFG